jgi:hypothetical protein
VTHAHPEPRKGSFRGAPTVRRVVGTALAGLLLTAPPARLAAAPPPDPAATRALQYEVAESQTGRVRNTVWGWTEPAADPQHIVAVSRTTFAHGGQWVHRVAFTRAVPPQCVTWEGTLTDRSGVVLVSTHTRFVPEAFPLLEGPFPPNTYPMEGIGYPLTRLGLGAQPRAAIHTVLGGSLVQVDLWTDGTETVQVPAGNFECYKVRMRANAQTLFPKLPAFLRPVLSFFIPTYTLWLTVEEPQILVQFVGQMGPPGSPELRMRLLTVGDTHP